MGTFLTSERMNPALRARVERAVSQRLRAKANASKLGFVPFETRSPIPIARLLPIVALGIVVALGVSIRVSTARELERERQVLLADLAARRAGMPPGYPSFLATTDRFVAEAASEDALPDVIDPSLQGPALDALLSRPSVYLHAGAAELRNAKSLDDVAGAAIKDAFLWCLVKAPSAKETEILGKVRGAYFGGAKLDEETANVRRLSDARMGLAVLSGTFEEVVQKARDVATLKRLKKVLDDAPTAQAQRAAAAETMIVVTDFPSGSGERDARLTLVDVPAQKVLLRVRPRLREVDVGPKTGAHRAQLEDCGLALAARRGVK